MQRRMELGAVGGASTQEGERAPVLPSRRDLLRRCRDAIGRGPVLLTGEPGSGKTWVLDRLIETDGRMWLRLDLAPSIGPVELLQELARGLGLEPGPQARIDVADTLREQSEQGRRWGLAIDEAHLAGIETLEEIRVLANRLGQPDGFDALVLTGQTGLVRRLRSRSLLGFQARLAAHLHVLPISLEEALQLVDWHFPGESPGRDWVARWHRETLGQPGLLIRRVAQSRKTRTVLVDAAQAAVRPVGLGPLGAPIAPDTRPEPARVDAPPLIDSTPPIEVGEGTIEVGWTAENEPLTDLEPFTHDTDSLVLGDVEGVEGESDEAEIDERPVVVEDHYAALQAWNEWTRNQGRTGVEDTSRAGADDLESVSALEGREDVRAEPQHGHAPYGPLFSRRVSSPDA